MPFFGPLASHPWNIKRDLYLWPNFNNKFFKKIKILKTIIDGYFFKKHFLLYIFYY